MSRDQVDHLADGNDQNRYSTADVDLSEITMMSDQPHDHHESNGNSHIVPSMNIKLEPSCHGTDAWSPSKDGGPGSDVSSAETKEKGNLEGFRDPDFPDSDAGNAGRCWGPGSRIFLFIKAVYFTVIAGRVSLLPFIPVYLSDLGLDPIQIGWIKSAEPVIGLLSPPACGSIADKYSKHKLMIVGSILGTALVYGSSVFVPLLAHEVAYNTTGNITDNSFNNTAVPPPGNIQVTFDPDLADLTVTTFTVQPQERPSTCEDLSGTTLSRSSVIQCWRGPLCESRAPHPVGKPCLDITYENMKFILGNNSQLHCDGNEATLASGNCSDFGELQKIWDDVDKGIAPIVPKNESICCHFRVSFDSNGTYNITSDAQNSTTSNVGNTDAIFVTMIAVVVFGSFFEFPTLPLFDASTMALISDFKEQGFTFQYGRQRFWGGIAVIIWSPLSGLAVDTFSASHPSSFNAFVPAFILLVGFLFLGGAIACFIPLPPRPTQRSFTRNMFVLFRKLELVLFFSMAIVYGIFCGVLDSYVFLFLQEELGASRTLMGFSTTFTCLAEVAVMIFSSKLIELIGHHGVISAALFCFGLRFMGYSLLYNPWLVLPIQLLHGITYGAMRPAMTSFIQRVASNEMTTTVQTLTDGTGIGLGKIIGSLVGGLVYEKYGPRTLFRGTAVLGGVACMLYLSLGFLLQRRSRKNKGWNLATLD